MREIYCTASEVIIFLGDGLNYSIATCAKKFTTTKSPDPTQRNGTHTVIILILYTAAVYVHVHPDMYEHGQLLDSL